VCTTGVAPGKAKKNVDYQSVQSPAEVRAREQKPIKNSRKSEIGGEESRKKSRNGSERSLAVQLNAVWRIVVDGDRWLFQQLDAGLVWHDRAKVESASAVRDLAHAFCQPISARAVVTLWELPESATALAAKVTP